MSRGVTTATLETWVNGKVIATERLSVSASRVARDRINKADIDPPVQILRSPVEEGDSWDVESEVEGQLLKMKVTVGLTKEIVVPAGTFKAVTVEMKGAIADKPTSLTYWLAEGVGIVRLDYTIDGKDAMLEPVS